MIALRRYAKRYLPRSVLNRLFWFRAELAQYSAPSYSQEGEDMILQRIFQEFETGFYIDVGAYHPKHLSNTYYFYQKGWRGINIDAMPGSMDLFRHLRPRDINIEAAVASKKQEIPYNVFRGRALNSLDPNWADERSIDRSEVVESYIVVTSRLDDILARHLPPDQSIQFMSVDVEGFDLEVLQSNNWMLFRPEYVLVEIWHLHLDRAHDHPIVKYLYSQGYYLFGKAYSTVFFHDGIHE